MSRRFYVVGYILSMGIGVAIGLNFRVPAADSEMPILVKEVLPEVSPSQDVTHPLDRELDEALDGLGSSSRTAGIYYDFLDRWDAELNRVYQELMRELGPDEQKTLRDAQRAWIVNRDADRKLIAAAYWPEGRDVTPTMYQSFAAYRIMNLTRERALMLLYLKGMRIEILNETSTL